MGLFNSKSKGAQSTDPKPAEVLAEKAEPALVSAAPPAEPVIQPAPAVDTLLAAKPAPAPEAAASVDTVLSDSLLDVFKKEEVLVDKSISTLADEVGPAPVPELVGLLRSVAMELGLEVEPAEVQ